MQPRKLRKQIAPLQTGEPPPATPLSTWDEAADEDEPAAQEDVAMSTAGGGVSDWQDDDMDHAERLTSMLEDTHQALYAVWGETLRETMVEEAAEIRKVLLSCGCDRFQTNMKVVELFSPPRLTAKRRRVDFNLGESMSFDLVHDEQGRQWDFTEADQRAEAIRLVQ